MGNKTIIEYLMNDGNVRLRSPFDKIFKIEPNCGNDYSIRQYINYTHVSVNDTDTNTDTADP